MADQVGYYSTTTNINYIERMMNQFLDFAPTVSYKTLAGGYDMICYNFANHILRGENPISKDDKGFIYLQKQLVGIQRVQGNQKYYLKFRELSKKSLESEEEVKYYDVYCKKLILAMPARSLELIFNNLP